MLEIGLAMVTEVLFVPSAARPAGLQKPTVPRTPSNASRTVLAEHADDSHRYEAAVRRLHQIQGG